MAYMLEHKPRIGSSLRETVSISLHSVVNIRCLHIQVI
jgi:hypothetical protein